MKKNHLFILFQIIILWMLIFSLPATAMAGNEKCKPKKSGHHNCQTMTVTRTRTPTKIATATKATASSTATLYPTGTSEVFLQRFANVDTPLYSENDVRSAVLTIIPVNGRVLFLDYVRGDLLVHVRYILPFDGQTIVEPINGWVKGSDISDRKVGTPTFTPIPRCYDC